MMPCPKIIVFYSPCAPINERFIAFFYVNDKRLPMMFTASEEDRIKDIASEWWAQEQDKEARKASMAVARTERTRKAKQ